MVLLFCIGEIYWISHIMDLCWKILYVYTYSWRGNFFPCKVSRVRCTHTQNMCAYIPMLCCRFVANDHRQLLLFYPQSLLSLSIQYRFEKLHKKITVYSKRKNDKVAEIKKKKEERQIERERVCVMAITKQQHNNVPEHLMNKLISLLQRWNNFSG